MVLHPAREPGHRLARPPAVRSPEPGRIVPAGDLVRGNQPDQPLPGEHGRRPGQRDHRPEL